MGNHLDGHGGGFGKIYKIFYFFCTHGTHFIKYLSKKTFNAWRWQLVYEGVYYRNYCQNYKKSQWPFNTLTSQKWIFAFVSTSRSTFINFKHFHDWRKNCTLWAKNQTHLLTSWYILPSPVKKSVLQIFPSSLIGDHKRVRVVCKTVAVVNQKAFFTFPCEFKLLYSFQNRDELKRRFWQDGKTLTDLYVFLAFYKFYQLFHTL